MKLKHALFIIFLFATLTAFLYWVLRTSTVSTLPKRITKEQDVVYVMLEEGERLEGISFNPNDSHMYILTKMDTCKPKTHYIQEFRRDHLFEMKVVVQEQ